MKIKSIILMALAGLMLTHTAHADVSTRPIVFIHGFNVFGIGEDCATDWDKMKDGLTAQGFTGQKVTVGYYSDDRNCDVLTTPKGTILTSIEDISHDLAWYIYDQFSSQGVEIDAVAHSMGGLVLRYALYRVSVGDTNFPPFLKIAHAATMASPYTGYSLVAETCHIIVVNYQCDEMFPLSSFIKGLQAPEALVPQGIDGTLWSGIGSNALLIDKSDGFVNSAAATSMNIPASAKTILPWYKFVFHTMYTNNSGVIADVVNSLSQTQAQASAKAQVSQPKTQLAELSSEELASADAVVSRSELEQDFSESSPGELPAQMAPALQNNGPSGILFSNVLAGGIIDQMGIQNGDIVQGCDQANINEPFIALYQLKTTTGPISMNFCIVRDGQTLTKQVVIQ